MFQPNVPGAWTPAGASSSRRAGTVAGQERDRCLRCGEGDNVLLARRTGHRLPIDFATRPAVRRSARGMMPAAGAMPTWRPAELHTAV